MSDFSINKIDGKIEAGDIGKTKGQNEENGGKFDGGIKLSAVQFTLHLFQLAVGDQLEGNRSVD